MDIEKVIREKWQRLKPSMDERMRRLWAGAEAEAIGWGGLTIVARATGLAISTVNKGRREVRAGALPTPELVKARRKGGGRLPLEVVHPWSWCQRWRSSWIRSPEAIPSRRCDGHARA